MAGGKTIGRRGVGVPLPAVLALLGGLATLYAGGLPAAVLFLPALLCLLLEQSPGRPLTRVLLLFGLAGGWQTLAGLWHSGTLRAAHWLEVPDLHDLAWAWLAQAGGWLLAEGLGIVLARQAEQGVNRGGEAALAEIAALRSEWNLPERGADDG